MPVVEVLGTGLLGAPAGGSAGIARRRVLLGLLGVPAGLALASCSSGAARPLPTGLTTTGGARTSTPATAPPVLDARSLVAAAKTALILIATYEATIATHPTLGPVLGPYALDHDAHLVALAERVPLPTVPLLTSAPTSGPTGPGGLPSAGQTSTAIPVPANPAGARAAVVLAEQVAGEQATAAARDARDGEAARLLASIAASRAVHALILAVPA